MVNEYMYDDSSLNVSKEIDHVFSIANTLRGPYTADEYKKVIIPMTVIRRFECALEPTKEQVIERYEKNKDTPVTIFNRISGFSFYNTSKYTLKELLNDPDNIAINFNSYIDGFSSNVQDILENLQFKNEIKRMDKSGRLLGVIRKFSDLDLDPKIIDGHKMGYMFEYIIRRFSENVNAGEHYTPREVIRLMSNIVLSEGSEDIIADKHKVVTVLDMACGTGGMLSTTNDFIKRKNPDAEVHLYGQEIGNESYAICLADMLIKGQNSDNIQFKDTLIEDAFPNQSMRIVIANPPFGTSWAGKDAPEGEEEAVRLEYKKGFDGRFGAGLPGTGDIQLLMMQHAIYKMDESKGRVAIITNGSPLFAGGTMSGESQIRRYMIEHDLIEAIIALPTDLFYNTNIGIYVFILSKNKRKERRGKIQLIDATSFFRKMNKSLGKKQKEISPDNCNAITKLYTDFEENEFSKIFPSEEFLYREYVVYQPLQRNYAITKERLESERFSDVLLSFFDQDKYEELLATDPRSPKDEKILRSYELAKPAVEQILKVLSDNISDKVYKNEKEFTTLIRSILSDIPDLDPDAKNLSTKRNSVIEKVSDGLSVMDKTVPIKKDREGKIIVDKETKDSEFIKFAQDPEEYFKLEVLPHVPDAIYMQDQDKDGNDKIGAEFPFTRYFYKYQEPEKSEDLLKQFQDIEKELKKKIASL